MTDPGRITHHESHAGHPLTISVVICTKDRPADLALCLDSLASQVRLPEEVIVVDASAFTADAALARFQEKVSVRCVARLIRATPGLTRQRNIGVAAASGAVILFLDDDTVLEPEYVAEIAAVYERDPDGRIGGVGGAIVPDPTPRESVVHRGLQKLFLLPSSGRGRMKRSGHPEFALSPKVTTEVEFLSGCNMSFRREVFEQLQFDERLGGYALGEDLHFSYRVSRQWRLILIPEARVDHRETGGGRPDTCMRKQMAVLHHYMFFREVLARRELSWFFYFWSGLGSAIWTLRHPGQGRFRGLLLGYARVARHFFSTIRARRKAGTTGPQAPRASNEWTSYSYGATPRKS